MAFKGFQLHPGLIGPAEQASLVQAVFEAARAAPFHRPQTPWGKPMSVEQTSFGPLGWVSDKAGYRYAAAHPLTGEAWPAMPPMLAAIWTRLAPDAPMADSCLINLYREGAKMGLHQDADEADRSAPVVSISLGDMAVFRLGGPRRDDPTRSLRLASGDVCVLAGEARMAFHGVDRILPGSSRLVPGGGRINLTLRRAGRNN
jgi:alkylated DNA repair protein (DNA oxidative demethylase)